MLIYLINYQCGAASGLIMAVPPLAQSALTLAGMFWITLLIDARLAVLSMAVVPLLYLSVGYYIKHIQPRLLHVKGLEGETLVDHPRGVVDAPGDRGVRPRGLRVPPIPRAGRAGGRRPREIDRAADVVLARREHDHRGRHGTRAGVRRLPRPAGPPLGRPVARRHDLRGGRLQAARGDQHHDRVRSRIRSSASRSRSTSSTPSPRSRT